MVKSPSFQFYPADWLNDIKLQSCSLDAQGLLINLMCLMHQANPYGYLIINGSKPSDKEVARLLRLHHKTYQARLKELILYGALKQGENGIIFCKRMVEDEYLRTIRREAGKMGGSPLLKQKVKQDPKQNSTPSSSSSFSIKEKIIKKIVTPKIYPDWLDMNLWGEFKKFRIKIRAPLTDHAEKVNIEKLTALKLQGNNPSDVINQTIERGWKGFFPVQEQQNKKWKNGDPFNKHPAF